MQIYNSDKLKEHFQYGEYTQSGDLITPPHPECQVIKYVLFSFVKLNSLMTRDYIDM